MQMSEFELTKTVIKQVKFSRNQLRSHQKRKEQSVITRIVRFGNKKKKKRKEEENPVKILFFRRPSNIQTLMT